MENYLSTLLYALLYALLYDFYGMNTLRAGTSFIMESIYALDVTEQYA